MEVQAVLCQAPTLKSSQPFNVLWCNGDKHLAPDGRQWKNPWISQERWIKPLTAESVEDEGCWIPESEKLTCNLL